MNKINKKIPLIKKLNTKILDLVKRNGWTEHSPRPHHPKKIQANRMSFKKTQGQFGYR